MQVDLHEHQGYLGVLPSSFSTFKMLSPEGSTPAAQNESTPLDDSTHPSEGLECVSDQETITNAAEKHRKVPFRQFTINSEHSKRLLEAMLLKPPFDKSAGP